MTETTPHLPTQVCRPRKRGYPDHPPNRKVTEVAMVMVMVVEVGPNLLQVGFILVRRNPLRLPAPLPLLTPTPTGLLLLQLDLRPRKRGRPC